MTCDELRPDYVLFAMGALSDPELSEIRAHLARGCENCAAGLREARAWTYALGASVEAPEPPRRLRGRILAAAGAVPERKSNWLAAWIAVAATALAAVGVIVYQGRLHNEEIAAVREQLNRAGLEAAGLRDALNVIQAPETREVTFGEGKPAPPRGRVFFNPDGILLFASNLPAPPAGKTYEMWVIRGGKPAPAGLFSSSPQGTAFHLYRPAAPPAPSDVVAVTLEAAG
ncbi:MAG TPA: anti-sigma factor, partial [Bryobacteraceae bacterium]|nr:anti-sigma factor [Bryobacteraceae bacterium]